MFTTRSEKKEASKPLPPLDENMATLPTNVSELNAVAFYKKLFEKTLKRVDERIQGNSKKERQEISEHSSVNLTVGDQVPNPQALTITALAGELLSSSYILVSQYQTLPECREQLTNLVKELRRQAPERPIACVLDNFQTDLQPFFDSLLEGKMNLTHFEVVTATIERLGVRYWQSLQPLLEFASRQNEENRDELFVEESSEVEEAKPLEPRIRLLAGDTTQKETNLDRRNDVALKTAKTWMEKNPNGLCIILAGELRIISGYLFEELQKQNNQPPKIILQAWEETYWQLLDDDKEDADLLKSLELLKEPVLKWQDNLYTTTPVPPLVKLDSFITWSNHQEAWPRFPSLQMAKQIRRQLRSFLKLPFDSGSEINVWTDPKIYCCGDLELLLAIKKGDTFSETEAKALLTQINQRQSYYLPNHHTIYLGTLDGYHMGEEIGHSIRMGLTNEKLNELNLSSCGWLYYNAINEAAGFLASKIVAPGRKIDQHGGKEAHKLARELLQTHKKNRRKRFSTKELERRGHLAGYGLGDMLYREIQSGHIEAKEVQTLYTKKVRNTSEAINLYIRLFSLADPMEANLHATPEMSSRLGIAGHTLHERIYLVGIFYFALFFMPALLWGEAQNLFNFPKPLLKNALTDLLFAVGSAILVIVASGLLAKYSKPFYTLGQLIKRFLGPLTNEEIVLLAAFSAIGEELLFRGAIQGAFGLIPASLLFGIVHFVPDKRFLPWTLFAIIVGFLLGTIYQLTGNLIVPIITHFLINLVNTYFLVRGKEGKAT